MVGEQPDDKREAAQNKPNSGKQEMKPIPDTGWTGPIPSQKGGDYEKDFLNKPPYSWNSDKFHAKYYA